MTLTSAPARPRPAAPATTARPRGLLAATGLGALWLLVAVGLHLTQGTADVDAGALWTLITGGHVPQGAEVVIASRLPRLVAALIVGTALGVAGAAMQSITRNPLASPDTTGVGAGAYLAMTIVAALGISLGPLPGIMVAFLGGIAAAAAVIGLSSGGTMSPVRLVLAGSVLTLGLGSLTSVLLMLFPWETQRLFAWGAGSLGQNGFGATAPAAPVVVVGIGALMLLGRRLDLLQLGDDSAAALGVPVAATRRWGAVLAVLLAAAAVTVAGPIGFIGLCAPALVRLLAHRLTALRKQRPFLLLSGVLGVSLVLTADVLLRAMFGSVSGVTVPTGVLTSLIGALFLVVLARRLRIAAGTGESIVTMSAGLRWGRTHPQAVLLGAVALLVTALIAGLLIGDRTILLGDVWNWVQDVASVRVQVIVESRLPRVAGSALAGACLALAGALVQAVTRNPLADPGILGVSATAGLGAVAALVLVPSTSDSLLFFAALGGGAVAALALVVLGRGDQMRTILVGIGIGAAAGATTTLLIVQTDPWNQAKAITWLGGSTYGTTPALLLPMVLVLVAGVVVCTRTARDLDLLQIDDTTPQVLGIAVGRSRLLHLGLAVALTAAATAAIGVIAFVGLVAPHAARMIIGKRHSSMLPLTILLGAALVAVSDLVGRSVIAPGQLPAGVVVSLLGMPYFLWLLHRMRLDR
ncbi:iron ABC transporter permease [Pseudactinotalea sp.]|uniref:iron ABC transporter permease n=1 Tax=Pseudactinotalea sp. TaxID=1926260 RepID=UPI003B3B2B6F